MDHTHHQLAKRFQHNSEESIEMSKQKIIYEDTSKFNFQNTARKRKIKRPLLKLTTSK
jgi:hypothetical protein